MDNNQNIQNHNDITKEIFREVINSYTRADALADGMCVTTTKTDS